ncbi:homeobox protein goosecoid-2-like [Palaemon carinicauda]|uniref:homeobox protein goosecoid-2-like n=1 Tax=Palaemon carinicauda TaxID=392227 RepID=UPI0035B67AA2
MTKADALMDSHSKITINVSTPDEEDAYSTATEADVNAVGHTRLPHDVPKREKATHHPPLACAPTNDFYSPLLPSIRHSHRPHASGARLHSTNIRLREMWTLWTGHRPPRTSHESETPRFSSPLLHLRIVPRAATQRRPLRNARRRRLLPAALRAHPTVRGRDGDRRGGSRDGPGGELSHLDGYRYDQQGGGQNRTKRMRTSFKHHQLRTMKSYFNLNQNPDAKDLKQLAQKTGLSKRVLQVWFQNARAKWRRNMLKQEQDRHLENKMKEPASLLGDLRPVDSMGPGITDLYSMSSGDEGSQSLQFTDMCQ